MNTRPRFVARRLTVPITAVMALNALLANPLRGQTAPENGVLLLESGQLLEGQISQEGDRFLVKLPYGEIRLHSDQVKRRCATAQEAYLCLRTDQGPRANLDAHLRLARWCLQHKLLAEADDQLTLASRVAPADEPRIEELRRRVRTMFDAMTISRPAASGGEFDSAVDGAVVAAAHHESAPGASTPRARAAPSPADSISVSTDQLRVFTSQVQPMLLNGCSAIGCHGGRQATFNVYRPLGRTINRELTERNLQSVLKHVDRANPGQSLLLQMLANPHGGQQQPWAIESDPRYTAIAQWVGAVAQPAELPKTAQWQLPPQRLSAAAPRRGNVAPASAAAPADEGVRPLPPTRPQVAAPPQPSAQQAEPTPETSPPTKPIPQNPFDPSAFNQRNHPSRK